MNRFLLFLVAGLLLAGGIIYFVYNKPHRDVSSEKPEHVLTADQLFDEYEADEEAANTKFLDKTLEVSGTVSEIGANDAGQTFVILSAQNAMIGGISATFEGDQKGLSEGQNVSLKCRCTGKLMDVVLINCTFSE
ncbi:MAG: hypothetical protein RL266_2260 [Bacteroidota bacterium]